PSGLTTALLSRKLGKATSSGVVWWRFLCIRVAAEHALYLPESGGAGGGARNVAWCSLESEEEWWRDRFFRLFAQRHRF
ncbi:unnamed protein product, partial [Amoebophrya sp. A25]